MIFIHLLAAINQIFRWYADHQNPLLHVILMSDSGKGRRRLQSAWLVRISRFTFPSINLFIHLYEEKCASVHNYAKNFLFHCYYCCLKLKIKIQQHSYFIHVDYKQCNEKKKKINNNKVYFWNKQQGLKIKFLSEGWKFCDTTAGNVQNLKDRQTNKIVKSQEFNTWV